MLVGSWCIPSTLADVSLPNTEEISAQYVYAQPIVQDPSNPLLACNCVAYVKYLLDSKESLGIAKDIIITTHTPFIGAIGISYESDLGHAWRVRSIDWVHRTMTIDESNFIHCKITHSRILSIDSPLIKGYR